MHVNNTYGTSPKERLSNIRQHLTYAKELSGAAREAFSGAEKDGESASKILKTVSQDVFEAGIARRPGRALSDAGERAEESLNQVVEHHVGISEDLSELREIDPELEKALYYARTEVERLGAGTETWLLRNAIDSAQREEGNSSASLFEMERSIYGVDKELGQASESAGKVSSPSVGGEWGRRGGGSYGRWRGRGQWQGHRHTHGHHGGGGGPRGNFANQWRERFETRMREMKQRGRALEETANRLDNPFEAVDASAQRGQRYQENLTQYVDQALVYVSQLERRLSAQPPRVSPAPSPVQPNLPPVHTPANPAAPIPIFDTPTWPLPGAPVQPAPQPTPEPVPPQKSEGFFKKPWRPSTSS